MVWMRLLILAAVLFLSRAEDAAPAAEDKPEPTIVETEEVSLEDIEKALAHHPDNLLHNGVNNHFHNKENDPHDGNAKKEGELHHGIVNELHDLHKGREKEREQHERDETKAKVNDERGQRGRRGRGGRQKREATEFQVPKGNVRRKRFFGKWMLWPQGVVPFSFHANLSTSELSAAREAMDVIELNTCIRFVESDGVNTGLGLGHTDSIFFVPEENTGCWSTIGRAKKGKQSLSACSYKLSAIHELGHVLGAFHEHESYDRVGNVEANMGNVEKGMELNFNEHDPSFKSFFNIESYDQQSLMHYEPYDFSGNGLPVMDPLYRDFSSPAEDYWLLMKEISKVYGCWDSRCQLTTLECQNEGYPSFYNDTCQCVCPHGLDPAHQCGQVLSDNCGGIFDLTADHPHQTIQAPDIAQYNGHEESCTWVFKSTGTIQLDFIELDLAFSATECLESMRIRRNLLGQSGTVYCGKGFEKSVFSTGHYLAVDLNGGSEMTAKLVATASAIFPEESCYNWNDRGETYDADLTYAEDYSPCLDWTEATECNHSPFHYSGPLMADYSGNACRNPGGLLHRPWCYTEVKPSSCSIRYCEPCQLGNVYDLYDNCLDLLGRFTDFCNEPEGEINCRKTCFVHNAHIDYGTCGSPPPAPEGATLLSIKLSYQAGDSVTYTCNNTPKKRWCLSTGQWSELDGICGECADRISTCETMLKRNATLCQNFPAFASLYCDSTCGGCGTPATCNIPTPDASSNVEVVTTGSSVNQGETVTYRCAPDNVHHSGEEHLACLSDGQLYGEPMICNPSADEVEPLSEMEVTQLPFALFASWSLIGQNKYTNITRGGALRSWSFYCIEAGVIKLAVFRDTPDGALVVGTTETECNAERINVRELSSLSEIRVQPGDFIGVLDIFGGAISFTTCTDNSVMSHLITFPDHSALATGNIVSYGQSVYCSYAAINAEIGPIQKGQYQVVNYRLNPIVVP